MMDTLIKNTQKAYELCLEMPGKRLAFFDVLLPEIIKVAEAAKVEERKRIIKELRISEDESIDCPLSVCCENCYKKAVEDRLEVKALINNEKEV